jgi:mannitol operon repressor
MNVGARSMDEQASLKWPDDIDTFWETDPDAQGFVEVLGELNAETERGIALVTAAFIDNLLGRLLAAFLIKNEGTEMLLSGFNAPLGTLASKIAACYALGLIDDQERRECVILRKIRNEFAHKVKASFLDVKIKDLSSQLPIAEHLKKDGSITALNQFKRASISLIARLMNRPHSVQKKSLRYGDWR